MLTTSGVLHSDIMSLSTTLDFKITPTLLEIKVLCLYQDINSVNAQICGGSGPRSTGAVWAHGSSRRRLSRSVCDRDALRRSWRSRRCGSSAYQQEQGSRIRFGPFRHALVRQFRLVFALSEPSIITSEEAELLMGHNCISFLARRSEQLLLKKTHALLDLSDLWIS